MIKLIGAFTGLISESITASKTSSQAQVPETGEDASTIGPEESRVIPVEDFKREASTQVQVSGSKASATTINPQESGVIPAEDFANEDLTDSDDDESQFEDEDREEAYWELDELQAEDPPGEN